MKKILVPVDFSDYSEYALKAAASFAKQHQADIVVLHMMGMADAVLTKDESQEMLKALFYMKRAEKRFTDFLDRDYLQGINVETTVQSYKDFNKIDMVARDFNVDLIVMGSHGSSGLEEVFVGSNTEKVVRTSSIPVLVVKQPLDEMSIQKVVFACDFNMEFVAPFKKAWNFFKKFNCQFQIVYVNLPERFLSTAEMEEKAFKFLMHSEIDNIELFDNIVYYNDYTLEDGLYSFSNKFEADVIALPTHGRRGLSHFFSEKIGKNVVNHATVPIMTFKI